MARIVSIAFLFLISLSLMGCELGFLFEEAGVGELGVAEDASMMSATEAEGLAGRYGVEGNMLRAGRFVVADEVAARSLFEDVKIEQVGSENPRIYIEGQSKPVGRLITKEGRIKFNNGSVCKVNNTVFAVSKNEVYLRSSPSSITNSNIISTLKEGHMVIKLGEVEDGWYKVEIMKNKVEVPGYIKGYLLTPLIPIDTNAFTESGYSFADLKNGAIKFPDGNKIKSDLVGKSIPDWNFQSLNEIQSFKIVNDLLNGDESYYVTVRMELQDMRGRFFTQVMVRYNIRNRHWYFNNVSEDAFSQIQVQQNVPQRSVHYYRPSYNSYGQNNLYSDEITSVGILKVNTTINKPILILLDGKRFTRNRQSLSLRNVPAGYRQLKIYSHDNRQRMWNLLWEGSIYIKANLFTNIQFDYQTGRINSYISNQ